MLLSSTATAVVAEKDVVIVWEKEQFWRRRNPQLRQLKGSGIMPSKERNGETAGAQPVATAAVVKKAEVVSATCECCGLTEECTPAYVMGVRERYSGWWVCGLCGDAVEDEVSRAGQRISTEEALKRHMSFSESSRAAAPPVETAEQLISAVRQLLRRSLLSPRATWSNPRSPQRRPASEGARATASGCTLGRPENLFSTVAR